MEAPAPRSLAVDSHQDVRATVVWIDELANRGEAGLLECAQRRSVRCVRIGDACPRGRHRKDDLSQELSEDASPHAPSQPFLVCEEEIDSRHAVLYSDELLILRMVRDLVRLDETCGRFVQDDEVEVCWVAALDRGEVVLRDVVQRLASRPPAP